jgi:hydrogenase nickel incorporation protein HypA/HybF
VTAIHLRIGALSGVDPEALSFGFEAATIDTPLAGTQLVIQPVPVRAACRACGREFDVDDLMFLCPGCQSVDVDVTQGQEMQIDHLVVE